MSLKAFVDYLSLEKHYSVHTVRAYQRDIEGFSAFAKAEIDQSELETIQYTQIRSWIVLLVDEGISNTTINRKISSLKSYYKFLLKIEVISVSPLAKHRALKTPKKVQVPFSQEEVSEVLLLLNQAKDFESLRDLAIVELLYATGMRRAELIGLMVGSIDFEQQSIKVLGKRNKERIIPLLPGLIQTIRAYLTVRQEVASNTFDSPLLITKKGVKLYDTLVYRIINRYFSRTSNKLKKSPHIIRHSFATHLLNQGADLNIVKELLGHASLASTQVYTHNSISALKDVYGAAHPRNKK
jgi:integrase/recombinase XerC